MTYNQAHDLRKTHVNLTGLKDNSNPPYLLQAILVAPSNISNEKRMGILNNCMFEFLGNEDVLTNMNLINEDQELYAVFRQADNFYLKELSVLLDSLDANKKKS